ncbi:glycosylhydrolase-like jelly roll fold domain-containing protein [Nocardioides sp. NPDC047086]|uniref:glycosylhydrolase-like jelly roll fold domain-containing protein n=1 Tax=Nocardioides sp. NPDC047086 TaxID=3154810 RepID=UPI003402FC57
MAACGSLSGDPGTRYQARSDDGELRVGEASYRMLVLPTTPVLDLETAKTLKKFIRSGGRVVAAGPLPEREAGGRDAALDREMGSLFAGAAERWTRAGDGAVAVVSDADALGGLAADAGVSAAELSPAAPAVRVLRTGRDGDVAFLVNNESDRPISTSATLPVDGVPEIWDPRAGSTEVAATYEEGGREETIVPLRLDPYETLAIVFPKGTKAGAHLVGDQVAESVTRSGKSLEATVLVDGPGTTRLAAKDGQGTYRGEATVTDSLAPIALDGPWTVKLEREGETEQARPLGSWTTIDPRFSGSATYRTSVDITAADLIGRRMLLDLGEVHDIAQVTINGVVLPRALWSPYVVDATEALRAGANTIEVRVTNTLLNQRGKANQVPPTSGLLGPVSLRPRAVVLAELTRSR